MPKILSFCLLGMSFASGLAHAQVNTLELDNPRERAGLKLGPFYVAPAVRLDEIGIDTNVFNDNGERKSDFMAAVTPQAIVWLPIGRRALVKAEAGSEVVWYRKYRSERSVNPELISRAEVYFRRFTLFANGSFVYSRQRPNFDLDLRSRRRQLEGGGGVDVRLGRKMSFEVAAASSTTRFIGDDSFLGTDLETTLNVDARRGTATIRYQWTPLTSFSVSGARGRDTFPLSPERDNTSTRLMAGVDFKPRALITGYARVGAHHLRPDDAVSLTDFRGVVADVGLSYSLLGATTFAVRHSRDLVYSFSRVQPYFLDNTVGLTVRRALGGRFDVIGGVDRHQYAFRNLMVQPQGPNAGELVDALERRVDTIFNYSGSVGYRIGRDARLGVGVEYVSRASTTRKGRESQGFRIGLTGNYGL